MKKGAGYILGFVGIIILILGIKPIYESIPLLKAIPSNLLLSAGIIVTVVSVIISRTPKHKQHPEVPIYHGREIVGFRRV